MPTFFQFVYKLKNEGNFRARLANSLSKLGERRKTCRAGKEDKGAIDLPLRV